MGTKCFLVQRNGEVRVWLRRFHSSSDGIKCPGPFGYHDAEFLIGDFPIALVFASVVDPGEVARHYETRPSFAARFPESDPRWPVKCAACDYVFPESDSKQLFDRFIYADAQGAKYTLDALPVGAMWVADWFPKNFYWDNKTDGHLHVKTPGGEWNIDSRASNCTLPQDRTHRCWVRHGEPPNITVDKNGDTCAAGAGSIICGNYHGFLRNGELT